MDRKGLEQFPVFPIELILAVGTIDFDRVQSSVSHLVQTQTSGMEPFLAPATLHHHLSLPLLSADTVEFVVEAIRVRYEFLLAALNHFLPDDEFLLVLVQEHQVLLQRLELVVERDWFLPEFLGYFLPNH